MATLYDFTQEDIEGRAVSLDRYRGKVVLVVNVASECGFTPQYKGLETLYRNYRDRGLEILGFPCNQFGAQEPGDERAIAKFCADNYEVTFPMFSKIDVNGEKTAPLYRYLKHEKPGVLGTEAIKWNFTKFLVDREGRVVARYAPNDTPESLAAEVEKAL